MHYQPAVDGIRGIGVLIVLLYHAGWSALAGSFLAIDMFFALSGYLITSLLLRQYDRWGTVPLLEFWSGRARRLLPAMVGVVLLAAAYAKWLADPTTLGRFRWDMVSALTFWSNWRFLHEDQSYFQTGSTVSPLLHTWSLSIEEQFYVVWPLFLLGWLTLRGGRLRFLPTVLVALAAGSAVLMAVLYQPYTDPSNVYYNSFTRAQALLLGCALAVGLKIAADRQRRSGRARRSIVLAGLPIKVTTLAAAAATAGLGWFFLAPFFVDDRSQWVFYGGFFVTGLAAISLGWQLAVSPDGRIARALSWRPIVEIGKRVYGLYIWHWPLFLILDPERTGLTGVPLVALRMVVVFVVAFAFDWAVERPIRRRALRRLLPHGGVIAAGTALAVGLTASFVSTAGARDPIFGTALPGSISTVTGPMRPGQDRVDVFGDSVAFTLWKYFPQRDFPQLSVGSSTQLGCGVAVPQDLQVAGERTGVAPQCTGWAPRWSALVRETRPRLAIVMSGSAELFDRWVDGRLLTVGTPQWRSAMVAAYGRAVDVAGGNGQFPVALADVPCYDRRGATGAAALPGVNQRLDALSATEQNDPRRQQAVNDVIAEVARTHPKTAVLEQRAWLCPGGRYRATIDGQVLRPDGVHFDKAGTATWWRHFTPQLQRLYGPALPSRSVSQ
nr:acyltransferase [Flexivirga aerilata]